MLVSAPKSVGRLMRVECATPEYLGLLHTICVLFGNPAPVMHEKKTNLLDIKVCLYVGGSFSTT